jgi:hypothetical protein
MLQYEVSISLYSTNYSLPCEENNNNPVIKHRANSIIIPRMIATGFCKYMGPACRPGQTELHPCAAGLDRLHSCIWVLWVLFGARNQRGDLMYSNCTVVFPAREQNPLRGRSHRDPAYTRTSTPRPTPQQTGRPSFATAPRQPARTVAKKRANLHEAQRSGRAVAAHPTQTNGTVADQSHCLGSSYFSFQILNEGARVSD